MIAALYVVTNGCYFNLQGIDPWDITRDARLYNGPHAVIAHPPCERWGNFYFGSPQQIANGAIRKQLGDDGGCFESALTNVRRFGGVLEHPKGSKAFAHFGIHTKPSNEGWTLTKCGGYITIVEQGHYGHRARKATIIYIHGVLPLSFIWGPSSPPPIARPWGGTQGSNCEVLGKPERLRTPVAFRDALIKLALTKGMELP